MSLVFHARVMNVSVSPSCIAIYFHLGYRGAATSVSPDRPFRVRGHVQIDGSAPFQGKGMRAARLWGHPRHMHILCPCPARRLSSLEPRVVIFHRGARALTTPWPASGGSASAKPSAAGHPAPGSLLVRVHSSPNFARRRHSTAWACGPALRSGLVTDTLGQTSRSTFRLS